MIKKILLIPLLLVATGCGYKSRYENVTYYFNFDKKVYVVYLNETKTKNVPTSNFFKVQLEEWHYNQKNEIIANEYYVGSNKLFVYYK